MSNRIKYYQILFLFIIALCFLARGLNAQTLYEKKDSLINLLNRVSEANVQINILNQISSIYNKINPDSALYYAEIAYQKAIKNNLTDMLGEIYYQKGVTFKNLGTIDSSRVYLFKSLDLYENENNIEKIIQLNIAIGEFNRSIANFYKGIEYIQTAINLSFSKKMFSLLPYAYNRMAAVVFELAFMTKNGKPNIDTERFHKSIQYVDTSFYWSKNNNFKSYDLSNYNILGACYQNINEYNSAISYYEKALKMADENGEIIEKPILYVNIGSSFCKSKNYDKAISYGLKGYNLADSLDIKNNMIFAALTLSHTYNYMQDYKNALKYLQKSDSVKAIVYDKNFMSKTKEFEAKYESQKKQLQIEKLDKERELQNAEMRKQKIIIYFFTFVFIIILILSIIIYRFFVQKKKASIIISNKNETLEQAYKEINTQHEQILSQNEEIKKVNESLKQFNLELEKKVAERTTELQEKNSEIESQNEEYKKINEELHLAKEKSEENDRLKSAFLANMSHEIRTPMNGILGFADLLKKSDLSGEMQQEYIGIIERSGFRMLNIINDIVDISKIESGLMNVTMSATNINEQIEYIYSFFKPEAEEKGISLSRINSLEKKDAFIFTDREKIYAILFNLIKNSIKYTNTGSIEFGYYLKPLDYEYFDKLTISSIKTVNSKKHNSFLEFYVKDTGVGVPKERQQAIFERFVQADISDKQALQGAGLGLAITKAYTEMLGGKIWIESDEGKGSIFYFTIPYLAGQEKAITKNNLYSTGEENAVDNLKILIAEDDETILKLISIIVKKYSREVLISKNGLEAVKACKDNPDIDLVLMDIKMPEMDGYDATKAIRQFNPNVIIIAQTAYAFSSDREKAFEVGCDDYISKPFGLSIFADLINKYFKK
ncbi:MAG: hypothetical protein A2033_02295 [Bacteroidetes bacterium GWA2_31_9]|nr:MAG: hypothetical protein A2033_02295 [Bacteroidetes bacterium GWA2_31_9]